MSGRGEVRGLCGIFGLQMNDYYLGTPAPIPRVWRITAWTIAVVNVLLVYWAGAWDDLFRVIAVDILGLWAIMRPEMFEDTERWDLGQLRWLRTVLSEEAVWYAGWLILLAPLLLFVGAAVGAMVSRP